MPLFPQIVARLRLCPLGRDSAARLGSSINSVAPRSSDAEPTRAADLGSWERCSLRGDAETRFPPGPFRTKLPRTSRSSKTSNPDSQLRLPRRTRVQHPASESRFSAASPAFYPAFCSPALPPLPSTRSRVDKGQRTRSPRAVAQRPLPADRERKEKQKEGTPPRKCRVRVLRWG